MIVDSSSYSSPSAIRSTVFSKTSTSLSSPPPSQLSSSNHCQSFNDTKQHNYQQYLLQHQQQHQQLKQARQVVEALNVMPFVQRMGADSQHRQGHHKDSHHRYSTAKSLNQGQIKIALGQINKPRLQLAFSTKLVSPTSFVINAMSDSNYNINSDDTDSSLASSLLTQVVASQSLPTSNDDLLQQSSSCTNSVSATIISSQTVRPTATSGMVSSSSMEMLKDQPLSVLYPVSSGCQHQRLAESGDKSAFAQPATVQQQLSLAASIQELIQRRAELLRQLADAPNNYLAQIALDDCDSLINQWALTNRTPGVFYGSTDAPVCTTRGVRTFDEIDADQALNVGVSRKQFTKNQPWVTKKSLTSGPKICSGIGKHLLLRMGWQEGSGVGKRNDGPAEPVVLPENFRSGSGRRGLSTGGEAQSNGKITDATSSAISCLQSLPSPSSSLLLMHHQQQIPLVLLSASDEANRQPHRDNSASASPSSSSPFTCTVSTSNKHPVTELTKYCAKNRLAPPEFIEIMATGPAHRPQFLIKVRVNGEQYQPSQPSVSKREAKIQASIKCLQALGIWQNSGATAWHHRFQRWLPASNQQNSLGKNSIIMCDDGRAPNNYNCEDSDDGD